MTFYNFFIKQFETFGNADEIYNAMDTEDSVEMIRAADRAISKTSIMTSISILHKKSLESSKALRDLGNVHYSSGDKRKALICYNMAIANALPSSLEMLLAVGNRSAVLFAMRCFLCINDIKICLTMGCPPDLAKKLNKRLLDAQILIHEQVIRERTSYNQFIATFFTSEFKNNKYVNCASSDVAFITNIGVRQITAKRKISPGKIVALEPAFVSCDSAGCYFLSCYYCNKLILNPCPCTKCCYAMFCSEECSSLCMSDYHSIECQIVDLLEKIYSDPKNRLTVRAAIKLSLKLGWDGFIAASENIGSSRMKVASTREAYSVDEPLSMLCYDDCQELLEGRKFNGSVICAIVLRHFDNLPNYFPQDTLKRAAAKKAMSTIMFHLYVHFTNTVCFYSSAYEYKSNTYKYAMQTCVGWFSMSSKLKHSCQPNLLVVGLNDHIALLSLRTIEEGEELTISFVDHFLDYDLSYSSIPYFRAPTLFLRTKKMCSCNVCTEEWSIKIASERIHEPMTNKQANLVRKYQFLKDICVNIDGFRLLFEVLDTFPVKCKQYHEAYIKLKRFISICQCCISSNCCYSDEQSTH